MGLCMHIKCPAGATVFGNGSNKLFVDGGGCLLALSKVLACYGFESSEFRCASEFLVSYMVLESQTIVVGVVMVVFLLVVCYESRCGFFWCYFESAFSEPCL